MTRLTCCRIKTSSNLSIAIVLLIVFSQSVFAATRCSFDSVTAVDFGTFNVFSALPNNNGIGGLTISCQGGGTIFLVTLSAGQSNSYISRVMRSGGDTLNYNLYTSAARNVVWGDGTGGSSTMTATKNSTTTLSIFGQIPAGQDATVGNYTDSITTIINF